ncbi:MAG: metallophosphoesterase [Methanoregula sp.]|nr:metallophosphoesterase [Methanoregula sp.]
MSMKAVILSDIHIGDNSATCWYQKKYHEPYLMKALDYIEQNAASINEVILLGDVFDFWTYPCGSKPPAFSDIVNANPNVLGPNGRLKQIADKVPVTYINGNHDMNVSRDDIAKLGKIRYNDGLRYIKDTPFGRVLFTHGSEYTIFNAQDTTTSLNPLPVGHFVTRAISEYLVKSKLTPGQTAADLTDNGVPGFPDLWDKILYALMHGQSVAQILLDIFSSLPGVSKDTPVKLLNGRTVTFAEAEQIYDNLGTQWIQKYGSMATIKSANADFNGSYIAWWAQRDAIQSGINADVAILGHTHTPKGGLKEAMIRYINCGYMCSPLPGGTLQYPITFGEMDLETGNLSIMSVKNPNDPFAPQTFPDDTLVYSPFMDFSCYISILNGTYFDMNLKEQQATQGSYIVPPPAQISPMQRARLWLQDSAGVHGAEGSATYANAESGKTITFTYGCPTGVYSNYCSPKPFRNKSDSGAWQTNTVVTGGHPFFVDFTAEK